LLALAPFNCALAQTAGSSPDVKAVEKSSAVVSSPTDDPNHSEPASEAAGMPPQKTTRLQAATAESTSDYTSKAASEAQGTTTPASALHSGKLAEAIDAFKESNKLKPTMRPLSTCWNGVLEVQSYIQAVDSFKRAVKNKPDWTKRISVWD